jgi:hypothetical protein
MSHGHEAGPYIRTRHSSALVTYVTASYTTEVTMMKDLRSLVAASLVFAGLVAMGIVATWYTHS